jgi:predicted SnoaL-like aldol condensation-catalyzing enzyme
MCYCVPMQSKKELAIAFEKMVVAGQIREAYDKYVSPDFRHHNPYFKGDRESLIEGMEKNQAQFANKAYEVINAVEEGDFVVLHARLLLTPDMPEVSVVHIHRFEDSKIVEEWDLSQQMPDDTPNQNGLF